MPYCTPAANGVFGDDIVPEFGGLDVSICCCTTLPSTPTGADTATMTANGCTAQASGTTCQLVCGAGSSEDPATGAVYTCTNGEYDTPTYVCATCSDGTENGDETGQDCGGSCDGCPCTSLPSTPTGADTAAMTTAGCAAQLLPAVLPQLLGQPQHREEVGLAERRRRHVLRVALRQRHPRLELHLGPLRRRGGARDVGELLELGDDFLLVAEDLVGGFELLVEGDADVGAREVPDVAHRRLHDEIVAEVAVDGLRLGGGLHDDQ